MSGQLLEQRPACRKHSAASDHIVGVDGVVSQREIEGIEHCKCALRP